MNDAAHSAIISRLSVRLPFCMSVRLRYVFSTAWNTSKIISSLIDWLKVSARVGPNIGDLVQREHPQNWGGIGVNGS